MGRQVPVTASAYPVSEVSGWPGGPNLKLEKAHGFYGVALIARSSDVMGRYRRSWLSTSLVWIACAGMAAAAIGLFVSVVRQ